MKGSVLASIFRCCLIMFTIYIVIFVIIAIGSELFMSCMGNRKEVIIGFDEMVLLGNAITELQKHGIDIEESFRVINGIRVKLTGEEIDLIKKLIPVKFIEPELKVQALDLPLKSLVIDPGVQGDPGEVIGWEDKMVRNPVLWDSPVTGKGVTVGIIDTGINTKHPDLAGAVVGGYSAFGGSYEDDNGHGTAVSSRVGARRNGKGIIGVAYECSLYAIKVLDKNGSGSNFTVVRGYEHALGIDRISLVNMSLGSPVESLAMKQAMENVAAWQGMGTICAAGNESTNPLIYPAQNNVALPVGAVTTAGSRASFSNYGEQLRLRGCSAPGEWVMAAWGSDWKRVSGTSIATPFVTGAMALLVEYKNPSRKDLFAGASLANNPDIYLGHGIINIERAIKLLSN